MNDDVTPIRRGVVNHSELQLGREIALELPDALREITCRTCAIGLAIERVERRHGIAPVFDWKGARARAAGHACAFTTWNKPVPIAQDSRLPPERDDEEEGVPF